MSSNDLFYDYWSLRKAVSRLVPRRTVLYPVRGRMGAVREKGRKSNYHQYDLVKQEWIKLERLLKENEVSSFLEISLRAAACPMPLNLDTWDALRCPFACIYCYADAFRASLYTSFFDNSRSVGLRHCNPDFYKNQLDQLFRHRGERDLDTPDPVKKAVSLDMPMRFGIRFEDFMAAEKKKGVALEMLRFLSDHAYPVMINTKSDLLAQDAYLDSLVSNKGRTAVHVTLISSNERLLKQLEPGAPGFRERIQAMKTLVEGGVRVVARIEPYIVFLTDDPDDVYTYMEEVWNAGVRHITFDAYSHSSNNPGIRRAFEQRNLDFDRLYLLGCDSQGLGSLLLGEFMKLFQARGFSCSTFDLGNAALNSQTICCEVGDWFSDKGFNWGSIVSAARFIIQSQPNTVSWSMFDAFVRERGGWLSPALFQEVKALWNIQGNLSYSLDWAAGLSPRGWDRDGLLWGYDTEEDFRRELTRGMLL